MTASPTTDSVFALVADRRRQVADLVEMLDERQLATPSLCVGWDVRTVAAHLTESAAPNVPGMLLAVLRAGGRPHRANAELARRSAQRSAREIADRLRQRADSRFAPPFAGPRAPLTEVLVHEGDIRLPLGLAYEPGPEHVRPALEFLATGRPVGFVPRGRLAALRLDAHDLGQAWGSGALVRGRGIDLVLAACGRPAALRDAEGEGVGLLRERLG
ncbi:maleylpyruvate isomerase family mycothiol-dependent enzyme [Motilibacter aurantiacus]|uniref:maleylpyruvate isomerase family mycothiol-dependent enzyme n=1 Tax=Motilibacter aurantiacus TaxID=2714955 RepID=UPI002F2B8B69